MRLGQLSLELGLAGVESTFPPTAHTLLYSAHVALTALLSHQHFVYCWATLAPHQDTRPFLPPPSPMNQQAGGGVGEADMGMAADLNQPNDILYHVVSHPAINCVKGKGEREF